MSDQGLKRPKQRPSFRALLLVLGLFLAGCGGEDATPIDPANPPTTPVDLSGVQHSLVPNQQMIDAARQQCVDDPELATGYIKAVDPGRDQIVSEYEVDCSVVRAETRADLGEPTTTSNATGGSGDR